MGRAAAKVKGNPQPCAARPATARRLKAGCVRTSSTARFGVGVSRRPRLESLGGQSWGGLGLRLRRETDSDVLIESALWNETHRARPGRKLGILPTHATNRFERGSIRAFQIVPCRGLEWLPGAGDGMCGRFAVRKCRVGNAFGEDRVTIPASSSRGESLLPELPLVG